MQREKAYILYHTVKIIPVRNSTVLVALNLEVAYNKHMSDKKLLNHRDSIRPASQPVTDLYGCNTWEFSYRG